MESRRRTPSLSFGLGIASLIVAASGTALAVPAVHSAAKISGSRIKAHSIAGSRLKNDTLTGKQIKESTLGQVPSARSATTAQSATTARSATSAGNASKLGGVPASGFLRSTAYSTFYAAMTKGDAAKTLDTFGPLTFTGTCQSNGVDGTIATITVETAKDVRLVAAGSPADLSTLAAGNSMPVDENDSEDFYSAKPVSLDGYAEDGSFALTPASTVVAVDGTGGEGLGCVFYGQLVNASG